MNRLTELMLAVSCDKKHGQDPHGRSYGYQRDSSSSGSRSNFIRNERGGSQRNRERHNAHGHSFVAQNRSQSGPSRRIDNNHYYSNFSGHARGSRHRRNQHQQTGPPFQEHYDDGHDGHHFDA